MSDVWLNEEVQKRMAKFTGITPEEKFRYVPETCREKDENGEYYIPKELWPVFTLRGVDGVEATLREDEVETRFDADQSNGANIKMNSGKIKLKTCKKGIVTWKNLRDRNGKFIQPPTQHNGEISDYDIRKLSPGLITELAEAINERTILTDEELQGLE